ncbi:MAG: ABC transporter ATP-binding protein [Cyclobacteriaceae bacterium]|nr:ABC transporter ATP-binding protein [Cyclobacteriaceae bacterium]
MLLQLKDISKTYKSGSANADRVVLRDLSLELDRGETMAILGPSGSGKSTLLNIIGTLDVADSGELIFDGNPLRDFSEKALSASRNREIGFIFQAHHLLPQCTVLENVLIPTLPLQDTAFKKECQARATTLLKEVGLWEQRNQLPATLSGGECQRTAVIRALINKPKLLLSDEPTGSLDSLNAQGVIDLMLQLNREYGTALIMVTHAEHIARQMDKTYSLSDGRLHQISSTDR